MIARVLALLLALLPAAPTYAQTIQPSISGSQLPGTATNDSATAGNVGEFIQSTVLQGAAVSLTTNTPANITSVSLTAGDWDCRGTLAYVAGGTTVITLFAAWVSATSATLPTFPDSGALNVWVGSVTGTSPTLPTGQIRLSLAATTTVFLSTQATFTTSTLTGYGFLGCRRVR